VKKLLLGVTAALITASAIPAQAQIRITEVAPWSSGGSPIAADWFELTNLGPSAVNIAGWKMDDNSNTAATAVALNGIASIAAGESVIFAESAASVSAAFKSLWFGANPPAGLQVGFYSGGGVGLSTAGDAVNIFDAANALVTRVDFSTSDAVPPLQTFENPTGLNNVTLGNAAFSVAGVNGAFVALNDVNEIGSPGSIANVTAVPEPSSYALMLAGFAVIGAIARKRQQR
jgi:hypothetical protein